MELINQLFIFQLLTIECYVINEPYLSITLPMVLSHSFFDEQLKTYKYQ